MWAMSTLANQIQFLGVVIFVAYAHFIVELIQLKQDDVILWAYILPFHGFYIEKVSPRNKRNAVWKTMLAQGLPPVFRSLNAIDK